ncbi:hypothetical protein CERSUDRAFT_96058 [Gelatoporia subvermispora B]|uniref:Transcription and mRNA export factor SUS1 n=1 Tax=Ceriporiopsis subvermispora (strain B) TaxID=914234 RepID=M2QUT4_CERS8|nr:hypothetical protein CERSUDRAFT_96058 [Gelatoporia subvermispora B]
MPARNEGRHDYLFAQLRRRMAESGEWDRIYAQLRQELKECGWRDDFKNRSKEGARKSEGITFEALMDTHRPQAEGEVPQAVKQNIKNMIKRYLDSQIEP